MVGGLCDDDDGDDVDMSPPGMAWAVLGVLLDDMI